MLKSLLRIRLMSLVGRMTVGKSGAKATRARTVTMLLVYLYLAATFLFLSFSSAATLAPVLIGLSLDWLYFALFFVATLALLVFFGIFEVKSELFDAKDNDLLLSLPIPARDIFLSRLLTVLIFHYVEAAILLFPAVGVYFVFRPRRAAMAEAISMAARLMAPLYSSKRIPRANAPMVRKTLQRIKSKACLGFRSGLHLYMEDVSFRVQLFGRALYEK